MFSAITPMYQNKKIFCLPVEPQVYYREYMLRTPNKIM